VLEILLVILVTDYYRTSIGRISLYRGDDHVRYHHWFLFYLFVFFSRANLFCYLDDLATMLSYGGVLVHNISAIMIMIMYYRIYKLA
jgi:hypothetical protein